MIKIGDICLIRHLPEIRSDFRGLECTILAGPILQPDGKRFRIEVEGKGHYRARPHQLKPLPPPDMPSSWDQVVWKPKALTVDLSAILDAEMTE